MIYYIKQAAYIGVIVAIRVSFFVSLPIRSLWVLTQKQKGDEKP